jgi:hypothetical protein
MTEINTTAAPVPAADTAKPAAPAAESTNKPIPTAAPKPEQAPADDWLDDEPEATEGADAEVGAAELAKDEGERPEWACPTDPELAKEWREARGIPADPDGYEWEQPEGVELNERAQETLSAFGQVAHSLDLSAEAANKLVEFVREQGQHRLAEVDKTDISAAKDALHQQWGDRAESNLKSVKGLFAELPPDLGKAIREARLSTGSRLSNDPSFLALLADYAALRRGQPSVGVFDAHKDEARITEIRRALKNDVDSYFKNDLNKELTTLLERQGSRAPAKPPSLGADARREAEVRKVMRTNYQKYQAEGLDRELAQIIARRSA